MSMRSCILAVAVGIGALVAASAGAGDVKVDPKLPDYQAAAGISGTLKSVGSDTMNNLMTLWAEGFQKYYPDVRREIEGKGSATAMPALVAGTALFGPMSRTPKADEVDAFEKRFGYPPVQLATSIDMLAVYVSKDNPLNGLTLAQVDAIFSKTRKRGASDDIRTWGQLGLSGAWANAPISLYGRNAASGTYVFFKEVALAKGDYKDSVKQQPGSSAVVQAAGTDTFGIGYSGIGYKTADVRALPLAETAGDTPIPPEAAYAYSGEYPLARPLLLTVNYKPQSELDPLRREFIRYIFSKQGQAEVIKDGYFPITADAAKKQLKLAGLE